MADASKIYSVPAVVKCSPGLRSHNMPGLLVAVSSVQVTPLHGFPVLSPSDGGDLCWPQIWARAGSGGQLCRRRERAEGGGDETRAAKHRNQKKRTREFTRCQTWRKREEEETRHLDLMKGGED